MVEGRIVLVGSTRSMQQLTGKVVTYLDIGKYRLLWVVSRRFLMCPHSAGRTKPRRNRWSTIS